MKFTRLKWQVSHIHFVLLAIVGTVAAFAVPVWNFSQTIPRDWDYFNALSWIVSSNVWHYQRFPLHDPWMCGGLDILANPQSRVFSLFGVLDLIFPPHLANLFSLMIYTVLGFLGGKWFFERLKFDRFAASVVAALYVLCSWFSTHFAEGHITYGSILLLPLAGVLLLNIDRLPFLWCAAFFFAHTLLDGGIYTVIFTMLFLLSLLLTVSEARRALVVSLRGFPFHWILLGVSAFLLSSGKWIPVLWYHSSRLPALHTEVMELRALGYSFFYPRQILSVGTGTPLIFGFHEYACYLGVPLVTAMGVAVFSSFRKVWPFLLAAVFWFWTASGWGDPVNPWQVFLKIPLVNNAHVQSRVFIIMFIFILILAAQGLRAMKTPLLGLIMLIEFFAVHNLAFQRQFSKSSVDAEFLTRPIASDSLLGTIPYGVKPTHYLNRNMGSRQCYEPAAPATSVRDVKDPLYMGEAYATSGTVNIVEYTPAKIVLKYLLTSPGALSINTNSLDGWTVYNGGGRVVSAPHEVLRVEPAGLNGFIELRYVPGYLKYLIWSFPLGVICFILLLSDVLRPWGNRRKYGQSKI